jgi:hypothetical protein
MRDTRKWADRVDYRRRDPEEDGDRLGKREKDFEGKRLTGTEYDLQLETVRDRKLLVNLLHIPVEEARLSEVKF